MWEIGEGEEAAGKKKLTVSRGGDGRFIFEWTHDGPFLEDLLSSAEESCTPLTSNY